MTRWDRRQLVQARCSLRDALKAVEFAIGDVDNGCLTSAGLRAGFARNDAAAAVRDLRRFVARQERRQT